ncbi:MAG: hypothetical protein IID63_07695 [candidate division Zixibacteria bacterium]|nr:hypothetical protein [candidate division Zixibacteria bacterium]
MRRLTILSLAIVVLFMHSAPNAAPKRSLQEVVESIKKELKKNYDKKKELDALSAVIDSFEFKRKITYEIAKAIDNDSIVVAHRLFPIPLPDSLKKHLETLNAKQEHFRRFDETLNVLDSILKIEEQKRKAWELEVTANYSGNRAGDSSKYDLGAAVNIDKGQYPRQFRFTSKSSVTFKNGKFSEDVSILVINYDYYITPNTEVYAFVERFNNSFLKIKQRYEMGFGLLFEFNPGDRSEEFRSKTNRLYHDLKAYSSKSIKDSTDLKELDDFMKSSNIAHSKRKSIFMYAFAFSFLQEIERPDELEIDETDVLTVNGSDQNSVDDMRTLIKSFITTYALGESKVVRLEEADLLTLNAQSVLRHMMEEYVNVAWFILT